MKISGYININLKKQVVFIQPIFFKIIYKFLKI